MLIRSALQSICALVCISLLAGCAQQQVAKYSGRSAIEQHQQLLRGASLFSVDEPLPELDPVELLAVNDDMRAFLDEYIPSRATSDEARARLILKGLLDDGLRQHYNNLKTYTAEEAFYAREGNCMSFTNLYVAPAREADLIDMFQEMEVEDVWSAVGDTHYYSLHVNVLVDLPRKQQVIDFDTQADMFKWRTRVVGDKTAAAQYTAMAEDYRMRNPYYLFDLAQRSYGAGDYNQAIELLTAEIGKEKKEHQFHHLRGLSWTQLGQAEEAKKNFSRAARLANDPHSRSLYESQLNLLATRS